MSGCAMSRVLLKTSRGARLTAAPWNREEA